MARDDGAAARDLMRKMAVAMVDDVENVKFVAKSSYDARVVDQAVQQAVGFERDAPGSGNSAKPPHEGWPDEGGVNGRRMALAQMVEQHLADHLHARPILLDKIANNRYAERRHSD